VDGSKFNVQSCVSDALRDMFLGYAFRVPGSGFNIVRVGRCGKFAQSCVSDAMGKIRNVPGLERCLFCEVFYF
jgi:hypothetical protein